MRIRILTSQNDRQWRMLLIYNIYRLVSIAVFVSAYWFVAFTKVNEFQYFGMLAGFLVYGIFIFYLYQKRAFRFEQQVFVSGLIDIVIVVLLINKIGFIDSGLGILLYVYVAMLSILAPGRLAIFFAAMASFLLLSISIIRYLYMPYENIDIIFTTGVYGAGFFATALTAWYLAHWVRMSELLAQQRGRELENIHKLNEYIVERLQYGVIYVDGNNQIQVINSSACSLLDSERCKNMTIKDLSPLLHEKYQKFLSTLDNKKIDYSAYSTIDELNLQVRFYSSASSAENPAVLIILNDMAEITQQAQQLKLASLGFFSASIAHELRNPLGAISHACQLLGEEDEENEESVRLKELILNNCERMNKIIKNVLQMSRSQRSEPEEIDLNVFLIQFRKDFCSVNSCKLTIKMPRVRKNAIKFDKSQLEQILVILCDNAIAHGKDKEYDEALITMQVFHEGEKIRLEVCDTGPGIKPKDRKHVFDPFFSTLSSGNGMGLFIAKDLCFINQARLELLETDTGCCFAIHFNQTNEVAI
ncbi:sensor histidine kinase [Legionella impletisoli]|uniref:histidine kinase n=1 Tax=Legionella impletisoli TaxID=343510 RepID=A0A917JN13_9GAMM|nr:HAMP domain-containing sensor histidine kinase [Legionella impletisoli]GGI77661.1 two-component sensor histidine kinase [Legionella impletisoli]